MVEKTGRCFGGQRHGCRNRTLFGRTGAWLEKPGAALANRVMVEKTKRCLGAERHGWKSRALFWWAGSWFE